MEVNPYQAPKFDELPRIGADADNRPNVAGPSEAEIRAFVGKNAGYYLRKWPSSLEDHGPARGFNWAAFLLSGLWVGYRKMYRTTLIMFGLILAESVCEEIAVATSLMSEQSSASLNRIGGVIIGLICGASGNAWYLAHAKREIARVRAQGLANDAYLAALARRGGTSYLASLGLFCLFLVAAFMAGWVASLFLSSE
jgi:Protein of unknown function (DUF2628)